MAKYALETLLVHRDVAGSFLPRSVAALRERGVELRGDERSRALVPDMRAATDGDYAAEFLDLILAVRVVDDLDAAIATSVATAPTTPKSSPPPTKPPRNASCRRSAAPW